MALALTLISAGGAGLLIPLGEVTALLRRLADGSLDTDDETDADFDGDLSLAGQLHSVADQIDAECIASLPPREGPS
ncbi:hypothetical protein [Streptomyces omiyaensis]|uniref:Uncharacterized protein n=1 Tax=Streptomyces omiyaensis TaxID=68247 RepID=A0ABW7BV96_9ACTN|nr:hypothetical protein [Streptomyces omiyaensis]GGY38398.1 hypothetical protein GCM10010363_18990 [Streptomyces omiyaensis]